MKLCTARIMFVGTVSKNTKNAHITTSSLQEKKSVLLIINSLYFCFAKQVLFLKCGQNLV